MIEKIKKFLAVLFLTLLIWTWAFLSLERALTLAGSLNIAPTTPTNLLVSFYNEDGRPVSDNLELTMTFHGAPTKVSDLDKRYRASDLDPSKERLDFYYNPAEYGHTEPGTYTLDMAEMVRKNLKARDLALTVSSCQPKQIRIQVEELVLKELTVEILDENSSPLVHESVEPARIRMYVPEAYNGPAVVSLTPQQIVSARNGSVREKPFVSTSADRPPRYADQYVKVRLPSTVLLDDQVFQPKRIGYILPPDLQGRYRVELLNENELKTMNFKATREAMQAYEQQNYHLLVQVQEGDENLNPIPPRPVIYNFPPEMVRKGLIQPPSPPAPARIRLVPLTPGIALP